MTHRTGEMCHWTTEKETPDLPWDIILYHFTEHTAFQCHNKTMHNNGRNTMWHWPLTEIHWRVSYYHLHILIHCVFQKRGFAITSEWPTICSIHVRDTDLDGLFPGPSQGTLQIIKRSVFGHSFVSRWVRSSTPAAYLQNDFVQRKVQKNKKIWKQ